MSQTDIQNDLPFEVSVLHLSDQDGVPVAVTVIKGTYSICPDGPLLSEEQQPVFHAGVPNGEVGKSSYRYEPECAFFKPATDVVLIGHAHASSTATFEVRVRLRVGPLDKSVLVTGDRYWVKSLGMVSMTSPQPFERIPIIYERAFGGWDRSDPDPDKHGFEPRNPLGTGFRLKYGKFEEGIRLPNLEDPQSPIRNCGDTPAPAGFGFISPDWQPRAAFAGTYDERWTNERMPLLPKDFDCRFFNAASPGLVAPGYLKGGEAVLLENGSPRGTISFNLPAVPPPECRVQVRGRRDERVHTNLDTIIINTDENLLLLIWRGHLVVRNGPHDVVAIQIQSQDESSRTVVR